MKTKPVQGRWYYSGRGSHRGFVLYRREDYVTADPHCNRWRPTTDSPRSQHPAAPTRESVLLHGPLSTDTTIGGLSTPTVGSPRTAPGV